MYKQLKIIFETVFLVSIINYERNLPLSTITMFSENYSCSSWKQAIVDALHAFKRMFIEFKTSFRK